MGNSFFPPVNTDAEVDEILANTIAIKAKTDTIESPNGIGDPSGDTLTTITAKMGDDTKTIKERFDAVDLVLADLDNEADNVGDASTHTLKTVVNKLGDDSVTVKARFDSVDSAAAAIKAKTDLITSANLASIGNATGDTLASISAKIGNDTLTIKARFDAQDVTAAAIKAKTDLITATAISSIGDASTNSLTSLVSKLGNDTVTVKTRFDTIDIAHAAIYGKVQNIPASPLGITDINIPVVNTADNVTVRDVIGGKNDSVAGTSIVSLTKAIKAKTDTIPTNPVAKADIAVPTQNSTANITIADIIGNKLDNELGNSLYANAYINQKHAHSASKCYPTMAAGITVAAPAGAWTLGNFVVVVPANTITSPFDIHWLNLGAYSANDTYELVLYSGANGAEVEIGRTRFVRVSNGAPSQQIIFQTPIVAANSQIKAKLATANGGNETCTFSINYHVY